MSISVILKGMAMGVAEAIPGVSGGTIAFITGIYERLLRAIGIVLGPEVVKSLRQDGLMPTWRATDGAFLLQLGTGMVVGLGLAVFTITELLEAYPPVVWAFFFGLIISSAIYVGRQIERWNLTTIGLLLLGAALAYFLTTVNPLGGSSNPVFVFLAGMIAISAMILPGISGSFILLLLGMYTVVFTAVRNLATGDPAALFIVAVFALGCLVGLGLFSRVLTYTFKTFPQQTLATLTGFMLGSLAKLWPWRNAVTTRIDSHGVEVPMMEKAVLPGSYLIGGEPAEPFVIAVIVAFIVGLLVVFLLDRWSGAGEAIDEVIIED